MVDGERRQAALIVDDSRQRHLCAVGARNEHTVKVGWIVLELRIDFQYDLVLIALGVDGRNLPLRKRVIEGVVDVLNLDAEARAASAGRSTTSVATRRDRDRWKHP